MGQQSQSLSGMIKKKQEQQKSPTDSIVYWSEHPDLPGKEDWTEDKPLKIGWGTKMFIESIYEIIDIYYTYIQTVSNYIPYIPHWRQHPKRPVSLPCRSLSWSGCGTAWCMKTMSKMHCPWARMPQEVLMHLRRVKHWNLSACRCCDPSQGDISWVTLLPDYSSIYVPNKSFIIFNIYIFYQ